jgi:hypothetical protein
MLGACAGPLVPTDRMPIDYVGTGRHGHYEKGGVALEGLTCGEQYHRAVAGVGEAEDLMDSCESYTKAYGYFMGGFVALPALGITAAELFDHGNGGLFTASVIAGVVSFAIGVAMGYHAKGLEIEAVHAYDARVH